MKKIIMMIIGSLFLAGTASANLITTVNPAPIDGNNEKSIWTIYSELYGVPVTQNDVLNGTLQNDAAIGGGLFQQINTGGTVTWIARYAADFPELYTYDPASPSTTHGPMSLGVLAPYTTDYSRTIQAGMPGGTLAEYGFKFLDTNSGQQWFTQKTNNLPPDQQYHFLFLNGTEDRMLVAVEDRTISGNADWDYNDIVFEFTNIVPTNPIPEPATASLLGMGLLGLLGFRRKQHA